MRRCLLLFILSFFGFSLIQSCTIQKRKHLRGWHITSKKINKKSAKSESDSTTDIKQVKDNKTLIKSQGKSGRAQQSSETIEEIRIPNSFLAERTNDSNPEEPPHLKTHEQSIKKIEFDQHSELDLGEIKDSESNEESNWVAKMFGGILGVLLALIAVVPLALLILFFNDGDIDDDILFTVSRKNSPFVKAFKKCFNVVFKIGATIIVWGIIILGAILLIVGLYADYGIIGVILGILGFLLVMWIMYLLIKGFVDLLFPSSR